MTSNVGRGINRDTERYGWSTVQAHLLSVVMNTARRLARMLVLSTATARKAALWYKDWQMSVLFTVTQTRFQPLISVWCTECQQSAVDDSQPAATASGIAYPVYSKCTNYWTSKDHIFKSCKFEFCHVRTDVFNGGIGRCPLRKKWRLHEVLICVLDPN